MLGELGNVLQVVFFGSFFVAWVTQELDRSQVWLTVCAITALIIALLALFGLINRRT